MIARLAAALAVACFLLGPSAEAANPGGYWDRDGSGGPGSRPHTLGSRPNGQACRHHGDCQELNCRRHPDGARYCAGFGRVCPLPGSDGARAGRKTSSRGQCYECKLGRGWVACG